MNSSGRFHVDYYQGCQTALCQKLIVGLVSKLVVYALFQQIGHLYNHSGNAFTKGLTYEQIENN